MIVELMNLQTGEIHASRKSSDLNIPTGLGHLGNNAKTAANLHNPWGTRELNPNAKPGTSYPNMHRPTVDSGYEVSDRDGGARVTWVGLTNGTEMFPEETLTVEMWEDPTSGALLIRASASSPDGGVYGVQVPIVNLHADHSFYFPSFGGMMYDKYLKPSLVTLGGSPFWEASVIGIEGRQGSLALWVEDGQFHPNHCFFNWSGKTFSIAIEHLNLMPFEPHTETTSVTWHLDMFEGGWVDAMTPYKEWYSRNFSKEMAARAAVQWADQIRVVIDQWDGGQPETMEELAKILDPDTVLFHSWDARAPGFDRELPDWTPRQGYVESVQMLQKLGFRTMAT